MVSRRSRGQQAAAASPPAPKRDMVWWSAEPGGRKKADEEFRSLPDDIQGELLGAIFRYAGGQSRPGDVKKLDQHIWEWRARKGNNHFRVLFFNWGHVSVALTAFYKNKQQTPPEDLKRANLRRRAWTDTRGEKPGDGWAEA